MSGNNDHYFCGVYFLENMGVPEGNVFFYVDCKHVYYMWAGRITNGKRDEFINRLTESGVPIRAGYSKPLHRIFTDERGFCPVAEKTEDKEIITFETCQYSPRTQQLKKMRQIILRSTEAI